MSERSTKRCDTLRSLLQFLAVGVLLFLGQAHAAVSDCEGTSPDGQAQCIPPTYPPTNFWVCDIGSASLVTARIWGQCQAELGLSNPGPGEGNIVALADCFDKKITGGNGGVTGPIPWLPNGTRYNDGSCTAGTVHGFEGRQIWGAGQLVGGSGTTYALIRAEGPTCPAGYSEVDMVLNGVNEFARCKPNPPCPADQTISPSRGSPTCVSNAQEAPQSKQRCEACERAKQRREAAIGNPVYPLNGAKKQIAPTGFALDGLELRFFYDSTRALSGQPLRGLKVAGDLWFSSFHKYLLIGTGAKVLTAYRGDGTVKTFTLQGGVYASDPDVDDRVTATPDGGYVYVDANGIAVETYNSLGQLVRLQGIDGRSWTFTYSSQATGIAPGPGYLLKVTDRNGRFMKFEYQSPAGGSEVLARAAGRITKVSDMVGRQLLVVYDGQGNLASLTWPDGKQQQFLYENASFPWAMTGRIDENGARVATYVYDDFGRAVATSLAGGADSYSVSYDTAPQQVMRSMEDTVQNVLHNRYELAPPVGVRVTLPNGQVKAWTAAAVQGDAKLAGTSQPSGSGTPESSENLSYDANGNLLVYDDFSGARTCYAYDTANREVMKVEGLAAGTACSTVLPAASALPVGARRTATTWHPDWRLPVQVSAAISRTTSVYHGQPDPFNGGAAASCTAAPQLANGKPLPLLCKRVAQALTTAGLLDPTVSADVTTYAYDTTGRLTSSTRNGRTSARTYHTTNTYSADPYADNIVLLLHGDGAQGAKTAQDYSVLGQPVTFNYDAKVTTTNSKFGGSALSFDGNADYVSMPGIEFGTGDFTIEGWFNLTAPTGGYPTIFAMNWACSGTTYGSACSGLLALRFGDGGYGNRLQVATNLFGTFYESADTQSSLAGAWHHIAMTRAGGNVRVFLDGNLLTLRSGNFAGPAVTSWVDNSDLSGGYLVELSDPSLTWYGQLDDIRVTKGVARYTASFTPPAAEFENPNLTSNGHAVGDLASEANPAGQATSYDLYDRTGRLMKTTDVRGVVTEYTYAPRGQVATLTETPPGMAARVTTYSYDFAGQLTGVQLPDGTSIAYTYDAAHRLTGVTDTLGNQVSYGLDGYGNRTTEEVRDPSGTLRRSIARSFDALGRLQQVTGAAQ